MATKKSAVNEAKKRIRDKLNDINEQTATLHKAIDETKSEVCAKVHSIIFRYFYLSFELHPCTL